MQSVAAPHAYSSRGSLRSRIAGAGLALIVAALVIVGLILSGIIPPVFVPVARTLSTFDVRGGSQAPTPSRQRSKRAAKAAARSTPRPRATNEPPPKPVVTMPVQTPPNMIVLSREDFAAGDIGKIQGTAPAGSGNAGASADSRAAYGPGEGPGGKTLYAAEWYREPTRQEIAFYMPPRAQEGWGLIACRTIERYHVDNCRVLGESPGSGIGSGLRQAAWQFLVLPPRINGRPMIGAWVRIRFDIVRGLQK